MRKAPGDKCSAPSPPTGAPTGKKKKKVFSKGKAIKPPTPTNEVVIKSPTPTKEIEIKSPAPIKGIIIRSPAPSGLPSVSSGSGHIACLNGSGPSMPAAERLALLAEEATSVCQPSSSPPDAGVAEASCVETLPPMAPSMKEMGAKE